MRITFLSPPVNMGGGTRVIAIHARNLATRGHDVVIVSPAHPKLSFRRKVRHILKGAAIPKQPRSYIDGLDLDHRVLESYRPIAEADVPAADVIIATWWETAEWVAAMGSSKGAKAYFVQGHEVWPGLPVERARATYQFPLHKIVVAQWLADVMKSQYGDFDVDVVPNSVDHSQFFASMRDKQAEPTVGFIYSSSQLKRADLILQTIVRLRQRLPSLRVISFSSEQMPSSLRADIEFHHDPAQQRIREIYSTCDVWVVASRSEGFCLPAMEAMACGTPVVATRTGWPAEAIIDRVNGMLIDVDDEDGTALLDATQWALSLSNAEWRAASAAAFDTVRDSSWDQSTAMFESALTRAVRKSAERLPSPKTLPDNSSK